MIHQLNASCRSGKLNEGDIVRYQVKLDGTIRIYYSGFIVLLGFGSGDVCTLT